LSSAPAFSFFQKTKKRRKGLKFRRLDRFCPLVAELPRSSAADRRKEVNFAILVNLLIQSTPR
jgi:hypothetical protein